MSHSTLRTVRSSHSVRRLLQMELLESRCVLSTFALTPIVEVSGPSPFLGSPAEASDPPGTFNLEFEPYLAVDPTNTNHLVGAWTQDLNRGIVAGVSFNGGNTWQSVVIPDISLASGGDYPQSFHPWVTFAPNGDVYVSSLEKTDASDLFTRALLVNKSTNGGLTWGPPTTIVASAHDSHIKESITADPTNSQFVYATWTNLHGSRGTTMFSRTTDGGQTWEPARTIFDSGSNDSSRASQIVVLPDGTLVDFFAQLLHQNNSGGVAHLDYKLSSIRSSDHGQTWQPGTTSTSVADIFTLDDTQQVAVPNPDGGLNIFALNWIFDVTVDPANGNLYAVWQDTRFGNSEYNSIVFAMSSDGGLTWSTPIKINQTPDTIPAADRQAFLPSVAVNEDGVVAVTYYDVRNNTAEPGLPTDVWMVHAHPADGLTDPTSWSSENRLTPTSFDMQVPAPGPDGYFLGHYQGLVAMGEHFGAFWAMPPGAMPSLADQSSIFFRDPLPVDDAGNRVVGNNLLPAWIIDQPTQTVAWARGDSDTGDLLVMCDVAIPDGAPSIHREFGPGSNRVDETLSTETVATTEWVFAELGRGESDGNAFGPWWLDDLLVASRQAHRIRIHQS